MSTKPTTFSLNEIPQNWDELLISELNKSKTTFFFLNSHIDYNKNYPSVRYDKILAFGEKERCLPNSNKWKVLSEFVADKNSWKFGTLNYDLKNELEKLSSENLDELQFPELFFFKPKTVIIQKGEGIEIHGNEIHGNEINLNQLSQLPAKPNGKFTATLKPKTGRKKYLETVSKLKDHIQRGDIYEINYCIEYLASNCELKPLELYHKFLATAHVPFSSFCHFDGKYVFSASPERFITKTGQKIVSQPIKGTSRNCEGEDGANFLKNSLKDKTENVMIVDLVRNDLSKSAARGSVKVDELFGIYSFPEVHQMISTISCEVAQETNPVEIIKNCFPMGSMTGAPKIRAMQLAEKYEEFKRGLYSGSIGYFSPENDFDFSVIIRTALYNSVLKKLGYAVGGAITALSIPEEEYKECLLKAERFLKLFE